MEESEARAIAEELFRQIEKFGNYGFNKSHAVAYAVVSYQTAFLKAHYPLQFYVALLNARIGRTEKLQQTKVDMREHAIPLLPADINKSTDVFTIDGTGIRYGLTALPDFGISAYQSLVAGRRAGPFMSLDDVLMRCNLSKLNEKSIRSLIKSGAIPGDIGHLSRNLKSIILAVRKHKIEAAKIKAGWLPRQRRKKVD